MRLKLVSHSDVHTRFECEGEITQHSFAKDLDPFEETLGSSIYRRHVLLNMENAPYVDSSGVGWLLGAHKRFANSGGRLVLYAIPPAIDQVLQLLKLNTLLHIAADEREALLLAGGAKVS